MNNIEAMKLTNEALSIAANARERGTTGRTAIPRKFSALSHHVLNPRQSSRTALACCYLALALLASGCIGAAIRSGATKEIPFQDVSSKAGPVPSGKSRLWIYVVGGDPNIVWNTMGTMDAITLNRDIYDLLGATFFYTDIASGDCRLTADGVYKASGFEAGYRLGKIQKHMAFQDGQEYFIRVESPPAHPTLSTHWSFSLVERSQAVPELAGMKYFTQGKVDRPLKE